ncbi:MAG: thioredoxin-dependent thiol peroxidase [Bacteroidota bacterium]|mgnify:FL=1|jgi:peroxiredoxin Q/BCP|nr:thioredoxin-dependent thiol peroxidase [Bacteroidales bacterium]MDI9535244.1 thioredoxin-dependent thiol peroxidase [Bacteroidota bacterium]NLP20418.1 thioredoxin-dependent thiol peroxidase [Bacteroidales bacterium]OQC46251.1 MAG: putative peroxiredoxin bcp [Bacteroidetes bacterium ADurb.Bin028]
MKKIEIGDKAPDFKGLNQDGKEVKLSDFLGKNLILYFYPKDSTPGCTAEACDLRDNYQMWQSKSYEILGVSPDSQKSHQKFIEKYNLPFDLISDTEKEILIAYNAWGEKSMYGKKYMGVLRKTYVINSKGIIENIFEKVKTKEHSNQILNEIK